MLRVAGLQTDTSEQAEQTRKLLRYVGEAVRRIEEKHQAASKVEEVFTADLLVLRTRLKELTWKLMQSEPLKNGSKALEIFWRKAFHEPVSLARQLRVSSSGGVSSWSGAQKALLESHLIAGVGHYHQTMARLAEQFNWSSAVLPLDYSSPAISYGFSSAVLDKKRTVSSGDLEQWVEGAVHRCLVFLGDLSRYQAEFSCGPKTGPGRFYQLAVRLRPGGGVAFNQLATLAGEEDHGLERLYYYLRCLTSKGGFEGGEANLRRFLEKSAGQYEGGKEGEQGRNMVTSLLQLCYLVLGDKGSDQEVVTLACQQNLAFLHQLLLAEQEQVKQLLAGPWLCLAVSVVIMLLVKIRGEEVKVVRRSLCQAWLLALLSHLACRLVVRVGRRVWGEEWEEPGVELVSQGEEGKGEESGKDEGKKRKNKLEELLRRRRAPQSGSEGEDSGESSDEIFESDTDDDEDLTNTCLVDSSDSDSECDVVIEETTLPPSSLTVVAAAEETGLVAPLRLCFAWLQDRPEVLGQTGSGSEQLWVNLARMFTVVDLQAGDRLTPSHEVNKILESGSQAPLWEDWLLRGLGLKGEERIGWGEGWVGEQQVARVLRLGRVRDWLCGLQDSKISWDQGRHRAFLRGQEEDKEGKKNVMKHMAELWLRQEVADLEQQKNGGEGSGGLIVVDGTALASNLTMVKRALGLRRFSLVVPAVAVQQLDGMKKRGRGARDAIRWLERELGRGHRWLRAQKEGEARRLEGAEHGDYPRQRDRQEWDRWQLAECLHHFGSLGEQVILLTADPVLLTGQAPLVGLGAMVRVEDVDGFVPRLLGKGVRQESPSGTLGKKAG